jgi:predicted nucleic acid-binding protein
MRYVVDASVVACWYFDEPLTAGAEALLEQPGDLLAPDLLHLEIARLLFERVARVEIGESTADRILAELRLVPFELTPALDLAPAALSLALRTHLPVTDGFYLALAIQAGCPFVTADRPLYDLLTSGPLAQHALWVGDVPEGR